MSTNHKFQVGQKVHVEGGADVCTVVTRDLGDSANPTYLVRMPREDGTEFDALWLESHLTPAEPQE